VDSDLSEFGQGETFEAAFQDPRVESRLFGELVGSAVFDADRTHGVLAATGGESGESVGDAARGERSPVVAFFVSVSGTVLFPIGGDAVFGDRCEFEGELHRSLGAVCALGRFELEVIVFGEVGEECLEFVLNLSNFGGRESRHVFFS